MNDGLIGANTQYWRGVRSDKKMTQEKKTYLKYILWLNLALGLQNLYFYVNNDSLFNFVIGALNIGVFVFYRSKTK